MSGSTRGRRLRAVGAAASVSAAVVVLVAACSGAASETSPAPTATSASPIASASTTATPTPSAAPGASIPTDCGDLVSLAGSPRFTALPLNDPAVVGDERVGALTPVAPVAGADEFGVFGASVRLRCIWREPQADITNLTAEVGTPGATAGAALVATLPSEGYACRDADGGRLCQKIVKDEEYPVDDGFTVLLRGDVVVFVRQANVPTNDLMGAIAKRIWG